MLINDKTGNADMTPNTAAKAELPADALAIAGALADAAGSVLRRYFRQSLHVEAKHDASPVTQADTEAEGKMRAILADLAPQHGILGEEHGATNMDAEWVWVIDPIDGTVSFITGRPLFTTLIALCHRGVPVLGVIDQPINRERWIGTVGGVATLNGMPIHAADTAQLAGALIGTTSPELFDAAGFKAFQSLRAKCKRVSYGGDAYHYALLANGSVDVVCEQGMKPYDFAALVPVITAAGGVITDWQGAPLTLTSKGEVLATANAALHREALRAMGTVGAA